MAVVAVIALALVAVACGDSSDDASEATAPPLEGTAVAMSFAYETIPGGNTTEAIEDNGELRFGNINFAGSGTFGDEPVDIGLQAHVLFRDGTGPSGGSMAVTDSAGDVLVLELVSKATRTGDGAAIDGEFTVVGGTGRFAGVTGGGSGTGERNEALGAAVQWSVDLILDGL